MHSGLITLQVVRNILFCGATRLLLIVLFGAVGVGVAEGQSSSAVSGLVRLLESGRVPAEREEAVVEMICRRGGPNELQAVYRRALDPKAMPAELRRRTLEWLYEAAYTRRVRPAGSFSELVTLLENPELRLAAVRLAGAWKVAEAAESLAALAADRTLPAPVRRAALESLTAVAPDKAKSTLVMLVEQPHDAGARQWAVAALAGLDLDEAVRWAARVLQQSDASVDPTLMLNAILERRQGAEKLSRALSDAPLPPDVAKRVLRQLFALGRNDPELSAVLTKYAGLEQDKPPPTPEEVAVLCQEVLERGDAKRGERIFRREDVNCFRCHSLNRAGGQIGPDLSAVGGASPLDYIVNSILNPNLAIKEQYLTRVFVTADGRVLTGIVVERDEFQVRIKDAKGEIVVIPTADIDEEFEGPSMMPQGITKFLTHQETLDLIRFVSELGKPGAYAPPNRNFAYRWRVLIDPPQELLTEQPNLEQLRQSVFAAGEDRWRAFYALFDGFLPLEELYVSEPPAAVFLKTEVWVHEPGSVRFRVECPLPWQAWLDERPWLEKEGTEIFMETGKHTLVIRVELSGTSPYHLRLEWLPGAERPANLEPVGGP
ncbi:MAG: hypothetical protein KatS3mg110_3552 [Pirellulaceae bacterium]|nr:MAG: hypothetical protein KatS3mg110_3552 [Pirellulaceae bacterium]